MTDPFFKSVKSVFTLTGAFPASRVNLYWELPRCCQFAVPTHRRTFCLRICDALAAPASSPLPRGSDQDYPQSPFAVHVASPEFQPCADPSSLAYQPSRLPVRFFRSAHFNAVGVINVVMMTMITTAPKIAELM